MSKLIKIEKKTQKHISKIIRQNKKGYFLRIQVDSGGCAGFTYKFVLDKEYTKKDICVLFQHFRIMVDKISLSIIKGSNIEYSQKLIGSKLIIQNPQSSFSCGCGISFSI